MICRKRLVVKHIQPSVTDVAAFQRSDQRGLIGQRAARRIDIDDAFFHSRDPLGGQKAARLVAESQIHRYDVGTRKQRVDVNQWHINLGMLGSIPADDVHSHAFADAGDLAANAAESDYPQGLAKKLYAFVRCPDPAAYFAIHARQIACARPEQCNAVLGDRSVTVALDDVDLDAALGEFADIHVAGRPGTKENDVLELG